MLWIRTAALALVILVAIAGGWSMADAAAQNRHVTGSCHEAAAKHPTDDRAVQAGHVCIGCAGTMPRTALATRGAAPRSALTPSATARSEGHTAQFQSLLRTSYAVLCLTQEQHSHT